MFPFLLELQKQQEEKGLFYTSYELKYVLPMQSKYSIRLYEILKSYQKNNREWYFKTEVLKKLLDCETNSSYKNFADFQKRVLDIAVEEINRYTDLKITIQTEPKEPRGRGVKIKFITFLMSEKSKLDKALTKSIVDQLLDAGQMNLFDDELKKQREQHEQVREKVKKGKL